MITYPKRNLWWLSFGSVNAALIENLYQNLLNCKMAAFNVRQLSIVTLSQTFTQTQMYTCMVMMDTPKMCWNMSVYSVYISVSSLNSQMNHFSHSLSSSYEFVVASHSIHHNPIKSKKQSEDTHPTQIQEQEQDQHRFWCWTRSRIISAKNTQEDASQAIRPTKDTIICRFAQLFDLKTRAKHEFYIWAVHQVELCRLDIIIIVSSGFAGLKHKLTRGKFLCRLSNWFLSPQPALCGSQRPAIILLCRKTMRPTTTGKRTQTLSTTSPNRSRDGVPRPWTEAAELPGLSSELSGEAFGFKSIFFYYIVIYVLSCSGGVWSDTWIINTTNVLNRYLLIRTCIDIYH